MTLSTLETFSHVSSQPQFIEVIANLLRESGYLILTTQNRSIYMRDSRVAPPPEGQLRRWVTMPALRAMLSVRFESLRSYTVEPGGNRGLLRIKLAGPVRINHFVQGSINVGLLFNRLRQPSTQLSRWTHNSQKLDSKPPADLVQIQP